MHTVIEIRPFRGGWQCFEGPGVQPYWTGEHAKEDAIGYATARAKFGRGEIRVLKKLAQRRTSFRLTQPTVGLEWFFITFRRKIDYFLNISWMNSKSDWRCVGADKKVCEKRV